MGFTWDGVFVSVCYITLHVRLHLGFHGQKLKPVEANNMSTLPCVATTDWL